MSKKIGFLNDFSFLMVFIRIFSTLHHSCNILIAINALSDIGHQLGVWVLAYHIFSGKMFISQETCFYLQLIPNFFYHIGIFLTLWIGIDRLSSVTIPLYYKYWNDLHKKSYLFISILFSVIYSLIWIFIAYESMIIVPNRYAYFRK